MPQGRLQIQVSIGHAGVLHLLTRGCSHDLERALCRFWLRGTCAKGETCEFLHNLPQDIDVAGLGQAMSCVDISHGQQEHKQGASHEEFPTLNHANGTVSGGGTRWGGYGYAVKLMGTVPVAHVSRPLSIKHPQPLRCEYPSIQ